LHAQLRWDILVQHICDSLDYYSPNLVKHISFAFQCLLPFPHFRCSQDNSSQKLFRKTKILKPLTHTHALFSRSIANRSDMICPHPALPGPGRCASACMTATPRFLRAPRRRRRFAHISRHYVWLGTKWESENSGLAFTCSGSLLYGTSSWHIYIIHGPWV
jgi:hypothetical protein